MTGTAITLAQAEAQLARRLSDQALTGNELMVRFRDRSVTYRSAIELQTEITYWARMVTELQRLAIGAARTGRSVADFRRVS